MKTIVLQTFKINLTIYSMANGCVRCRKINSGQTTGATEREIGGNTKFELWVSLHIPVGYCGPILRVSHAPSGFGGQANGLGQN